MAKQSFVWTCLPNGLSEDRDGLRVSVLVSPRLDAEADPPRLSSFSDWLDWPATLIEAAFVFLVNGQPVARSAVADVSGFTRHDTSIGAPDSSVWTALFPQTLPVQAYRLNTALLDSQVCSFSSTDVHDLVKDLYVDLADRSASELPRIGLDLIDDPAWGELIDVVQQIDRWGTDRESRYLPGGQGTTQIERRFSMLGRLAGARAGTARGSFSEKVRHLARFELFHTPPLRPQPLAPKARTDDPRIVVASQEFERPPEPSAQALADSLDFHRIVAAMNAYPTLQRRLGLVVDFVLDRRAFPTNADFMLRVEVDLPNLGTSRGAPDLSPVTHTRHTDQGLAAISRVFPGPGDETRVENGLLDLYTQPGSYALLQADIDGAGLKLMNFARSLGCYEEDSGPDPALLLDDVSRQDKRVGAPALRTAGMMLVRKDRALALKARMAANKQQALDAASPVPSTQLWAEDLVRGYRFDAWDAQTGRWRSLCRRTAEYRLSQGQLIVAPSSGEEEATVQLAATKSPDPTYNADIINLHEALVSWTGWSLAAPPPGKGVGDDLQKGPDGKPPFTDGAEPVAGLDLQSRFRALPGSLPRLRYGRGYALRARAVDLAGNSLPPIEEDFGPEQPGLMAQPFLRFEPVAAPVLALLRPENENTEPPWKASPCTGSPSAA